MYKYAEYPSSYKKYKSLYIIIVREVQFCYIWLSYEKYKSLFMIIVWDVHICCTCSHRTTSTNCCTELAYEMCKSLYMIIVRDVQICRTWLSYEKYKSLYMLSSYEKCKYYDLLQSIHWPVSNLNTLTLKGESETFIMCWTKCKFYNRSSCHI